MAKLNLRFNAGGQCDLCGGRASVSPLKERKIMLTEGSIILFNVCLACILEYQLKAIKIDDYEDIEIEKEYFDIVVKN